MDFSDIGSAFGGFMDDYGIPLGFAGQGAGTFMRSRANKKVREEQARRVQAHAERQRRIQADIDAENAAALPQFTPQAQEAARASIADQYAQYMAPTMQAGVGDYVTGTATAPAEVTERAARELEGARKKGADYSKSSANLASFGGLDQRNRLALNTTRGNVSALASESAGQRDLLPFQLEAAKSKGGGLNLGADLANGLGSIAMLYGLTAPRKPSPPPAGSGIRIGAAGQGLRLPNA